VQTAIRWLDVLFGKGDSDYPFWLLTVRVNILLFLLCTAVVVAWNLSPARLRRERATRTDIYIALALTAVAGALRFLAVEHNLSELGGIGYSRILLGYKGHFGTAQLYSLVYARSGRDLEHAILLNRIASTLTVPVVYALCRRLAPAVPAFALSATALLALHPLHLLFSATDALPISASLLAAASYLLLAIAVGEADAPAWARVLSAMGGATGLTLLTQVRYENVLFIAPPVIYFFAWRRALSVRRLAPGAICFALFIAVYTVDALRWGLSYQSPIPLADCLRAAVRELFGNPIFAIAPVLVGTAAAIIDRRSRLRWLAPLPLIAVVPLIALASPLGHHLARTYVNHVLLLSLVAGYGLALLWESPWRGRRAVAVGCLLWAGVLPVLFWPNLRERHLETAEHDFFRASLASLPPGVDRIVVPDDERLSRETHSIIESMNKYRMIADAAGTPGIDLVGMTRFLEHPGDIDCSRGNCLFFRGVPCMDISHYWFAEPACGQLMATRAGPPVREEEVVAGSFLDCSIYRGAARRQLCEPTRKPQRFGFYRITNQPDPQSKGDR
jgi:hypothetical protein